MKEVQIRRREMKSFLPPEVVADTLKILGSVLVGQGPLRPDGMDDLVSQYLGMDKAEKEFPNTARNFWADIRVKVPVEGKVLNVTTDDNKHPQNIQDYLIYKWCQVHKLVAQTKDEMTSNPYKLFYIHDPEVESQRSNKEVKLKTLAYTEFRKIMDDEDKINRTLRLLSDVDPARMSKAEKENYLDTLVTDNPKRFLAIVQDKNLDVKAEIAELVSKEIVNKIGNQYYYIEQKLGENEDEAVLFMNDKSKSKTVLEMKSKLEEARKIYG